MGKAIESIEGKGVRKEPMGSWFGGGVEFSYKGKNGATDLVVTYKDGSKKMISGVLWFNAVKGSTDYADYIRIERYADVCIFRVEDPSSFVNRSCGPLKVYRTGEGTFRCQYWDSAYDQDVVFNTTTEQIEEELAKPTWVSSSSVWAHAICFKTLREFVNKEGPWAVA